MGLGTEIVFEHKRNGYDVYSVGMPHKEGELVPPTGLPVLVLYRDGTAKVIAGAEALDWL